MARDLTLHVGPVTLQPRFNPVAAGAGVTIERPPDPRLSSLWAAAWTLGSVAALTQGGAQELTFFEALGRRGIMPTGASRERSLSAAYPICEVLRQLSGHWGDGVLDTEAIQDGKLAVLGVAHDAALTLFVSNLCPVAHAVQVEDVGTSFTRTSLDSAMAEKMANGIWEQPAAAPIGSGRFELAPHQVAVLTSANRN
jgi:hypothetical protein